MYCYDVNIYAVILAALVNIFLGALWYSHKVFGLQWANAHQMNIAELKPTPLHYAGAVFVSLVMAGTLGFLIHYFKITQVSQGIVLSFWIWLGFVATTHFSGVIWAKKPIVAFLIDTSLILVSLLIMGLILTLWQ